MAKWTATRIPSLNIYTVGRKYTTHLTLCTIQSVNKNLSVTASSCWGGIACLNFVSRLLINGATLLNNSSKQVPSIRKKFANVPIVHEPSPAWKSGITAVHVPLAFFCPNSVETQTLLLFLLLLLLLLLLRKSAFWVKHKLIITVNRASCNCSRLSRTSILELNNTANVLARLGNRNSWSVNSHIGKTIPTEILSENRMLITLPRILQRKHSFRVECSVFPYCIISAQLCRYWPNSRLQFYWPLGAQRDLMGNYYA